MPYIIFPDKWKDQPTYVASIDWRHQLANKLITAPLFSMRNAFYDPATSSPWSNTNLFFSETDQGIAASGTGTQYADLPASGITYPFSAAALFRVPDVANYYKIFGLGSSGPTNSYLAFRGDVISDPIRLVRTNSDPSETTTSIISEVTANVWQYASIVVRSANNGSIFCNRKATTNPVTSVEVSPDTFTHVRLGGQYNNPNLLLNGSIALFAVWNREIERDEHLALSENPWQFYRKDVGTVYFIPAVAGISKPVAYHHRQTQGLAA